MQYMVYLRNDSLILNATNRVSRSLFSSFLVILKTFTSSKFLSILSRLGVNSKFLSILRLVGAGLDLLKFMSKRE